MTAFVQLSDPDNPENANAGNGGDVVKHTALLSMVRYLGTQPPWRDDLRLRECHAGRGVYVIGENDARRHGLARLACEEGLALSVTQHAALGRVGTSLEAGHYAGSSLLLAQAAPRVSCHEAYEWDPRTRAILRAVADQLDPERWTIPGEGDASFDGETRIGDRMWEWDQRDLVVLDPFGLWRHPKHAFRRARYRRVFERWSGHTERPCLFAFFTWGQDQRGEGCDVAADRQLFRRAWGPVRPAQSTRYASAVVDGYRSLRAMAVPMLRLRWHWDLTCVVWLAVPEPHLEPLRSRLALDLDALFDRLAPTRAWAELSMVYGPGG